MRPLAATDVSYSTPRKGRFATVFLLSTALCLLPLAAAAASELTEASILAFMSEYEKALQNEDFGNVAPLVHPNAIFRFSEGDFVGLARIEKAFEKTWALDVENVRYFLTNVKVINIDVASATVVFNWNWEGDSSEDRFNVVGRGTVQIVQHDGRLKLLLEHLSR